MYLIKYLFIIFFALSTAVANTQKAGFIEDWQRVLGEVWEDTIEGMPLIGKSDHEVENTVVESKQRIIELGIAYGTEKEEWLVWAVEEFAKTKAGENIKINLIPMGSIEGARAILNRDNRIHVWSPASSIVRQLLSDTWLREYDKDPIISDAPLVLTPMVIVMWKDRYEGFIEKYKEMNFKTISQAINNDGGWEDIANHPEWGFFTFGHTDSSQSNSGLLTLVLMAYDFWELRRGITLKHVTDKAFIEWLKATEYYMSTEVNSTGNLMVEMLRFGPSEYNGIIVYENLALSNLNIAKGRWGEIKVVYPSRSVWNDNPYYILEVPWSSNAQQKAAQVFRDFLLTKRIQRVARDKYLFRPTNIDLPIIETGSSFNQLQDIMILDVPAIQRPSAKVVDHLLHLWRRIK